MGADQSVVTSKVRMTTPTAGMRPPSPWLDRHWSCVVLVAVYVGIVILSCSAYMAGVLSLAILEKYGGGKGRVSFVGALNSGLLCLLGPMASVVINRYSCRVSIFAGGLLLFLGCLASAFVNRIDLLIVTYGVVGGIGNALASTSYVIVLGYNFTNRRNLVISMSCAFIGVGMFIAGPMGIATLEAFGLSGTFLILSGLNAQLCVVAVICRPSSLEIKLKRDRWRHRLKQQMTEEKRTRCLTFNSILGGESVTAIYKNIPLWLFLFSTMTWNMTLSICIMHLPTYMSIKGANDGQIATILMCFSISNTLGRFLGGLTVDRSRLDSLVLHVIMLGVAGVVTLAFPHYGPLPGGDYVFSVIIGLFTGGPNSLMTPITLRMVDLDMLSLAHGLEYFFSGIGFVFATPIAGYLFDQTGSYDYSFYFAGSIVMLGSLLAVLASVGIRSSVASDDVIHVNLTSDDPASTALVIQQRAYLHSGALGPRE